MQTSFISTARISLRGVYINYAVTFSVGVKETRKVAEKLELSTAL